MYRLSNAYDARDEIKNVGGTYDGATKTWLVTDEQYAQLLEFAAASARRFNKRDTQFAKTWAKVKADGEKIEGSSPSDGLAVDEKGRLLK
jgi:hypothetical protein